MVSLLSRSNAQTQIISGTDSYYVWLPYTSTRIHQSDSVQPTAIILTNGAISGINWTQISGPAVTITPSYTTRVGIMGQSTFWLQGLAPGMYIFQATATVNGKSFTISDTVTSIANAVCPTIPPASARIASWSVVQSGGIGRLQVIFWDQLFALLP